MKNDFKVSGYLRELTYNGKKYWGFDREILFPEEFGGHRFTEEEKAALQGGKKVFVTGLWSSAKSKFYDAELIYEEGRIKPVFPKRKKGKK